MKTVQKLEFQTGSREELLPDFESAFPYIASNAKAIPPRSSCAAVHISWLDTCTAPSRIPHKSGRE